MRASSSAAGHKTVVEKKCRCRLSLASGGSGRNEGGEREEEVCFLPIFRGKSEKQMDAEDKLVIEGARGEEGSRIRRVKREERGEGERTRGRRSEPGAASVVHLICA